MNAADYIVQILRQQKVTHVYELVGGMITFLIDALHRDGHIRVISMHHEQGAAFAVDGHGRMTGLPAVALATSGPGATNLLTGIASCYFDSTPAVFITGQVNRHEMKGSSGVRQLGFQETDIVSMAKPVTKAAWQILDAAELPRRLSEAFALACEGRPGPVLLDIPMDVQRANIAETISPAHATPPALSDESSREAVSAILENLARAKRPLILAGGGIRASHAATLFREAAEALGVPVVYSLLGVDVLPYSSPLRVGMIGSYGNRWANLALDASDFLLVLGSRLDVRQTGADTKGFKAGRQIHHVDCDPSEVNNRVTGCTFAHSTLDRFLPFLIEKAGSAKRIPREAWLREIQGLRTAWPDTSECNADGGINPNAFMHALSGVSTAAAAYVVDVGQHQMWAAQSLRLGPEQRFLTSGGMGAMGFALPASIGAAFAATPLPVVVIAGDGGFQCNIQELETVARNSLPLKIVVLNNRTHGMVRQFQESYFQGRYASTLWGYSAPDFRRVAEAYGIDSAVIRNPYEIAGALNELWKQADKPYLLEVAVSTGANAYPKLAFGKGLSSMEPLEKPIAMEST